MYIEGKGASVRSTLLCARKAYGNYLIIMPPDDKILRKGILLDKM